ncbi:MAG: hypothetical protein GC151_12385 [Betaproteobacteria bacterium]|nr:hypothetical protein [Betaproteobacteria bacterium]
MPLLRALSPIPLVAVLLYGAWMTFSYVILLDANPAYIWHFVLYGLTGVLVWQPQLVRPRRGRRGRPAHFVLVSVVWGTLVAMPFATMLQGALGQHPVATALLWIGGLGALACVWAWLLYRYRWKTVPIFVVAGLVAITEPAFALVRLGATGQWGSLLVLLPVLHAVHACLIAPIANAYREELPRADARAPGLKGYALASLLCAAGFLGGTAAWFWTVRAGFSLLAGH